MAATLIGGMTVHKISSHDILDPYLAIGISKEIESGIKESSQDSA